MKEFLNTHKKKLTIGGIIGLVVILPLIIWQISKNQENRSRANADVTLSLSATPSAGTTFSGSTIPVATPFDLKLTINTAGKNVSAVDITYLYDKDKIEITGLDPVSPITEITHNDSTSTGRFRFVGANISTSAVTGTSVGIVTLHAKGKTAGTAQITYADVKIAAIGSGSTPLTFDGAGTTITFGEPVCNSLVNCPSTEAPTGCHYEGRSACSCGTLVSNTGGACTVTTTAVACGGNTNPPRPACPTGSSCVNATGAPAGDVGGTCQPSSCTIAIGADNATDSCPSGFSCILNANASCTNSIPGSCSGTCQPKVTLGCNGALDCQCNSNNECNSHYCQGVRATDSSFTPGKCATPPSPTATPTPTPTPINMCTGTKNRPQACSCTTSSQCRSGICTSGTCTAAAITPVPAGSTGLSLAVGIPGIGQKLANNDDNPTPVNMSRIASVKVLDNNNVVSSTSDAQLVFNPTTFKFEGPLDLGAQFTTGSYIVKVGLDNTLLKKSLGIVNITNRSASNTASFAPLVAGDLNQDNVINVQDYNNFIACYRNQASCTADIRALADINDNGQIDIFDLNILSNGFNVRDGD